MSHLEREVTVADALPWLAARPEMPGCSFVTSLPDFSEFPSLTLDQWQAWFRAAARAVIDSTPPAGVAIFYQTDIKVEGVWIDKAFLIQQAAHERGVPLLWHKVVCKAPPGQATFGRPGYSHLLCFSRGVRAELSHSTADVLPQAGEVTWTRGMGVEACRLACRFIARETSTRTVVDPFCGHGTVLAVANFVGFHAVGVELGGKRARKARALRLDSEGELTFVQPDAGDADAEPLG
jgi:hypothetical protein